MVYLALHFATPGQHPLRLARTNTCAAHRDGPKPTWSICQLDKKWPKLKTLIVKNIEHTASQVGEFQKINSETIESVDVLLWSCVDYFPCPDTMATLVQAAGDETLLDRVHLAKEENSWDFCCTDLSVSRIMYWNLNALDLYRKYTIPGFDEKEAVAYYTFRVEMEIDWARWAERFTWQSWIENVSKQHSDARKIKEAEKEKQLRGD